MAELKRYGVDDFANMNKAFRTNLVNSLSGFKSANLVGTKNHAGVSNLAIITSVVHLGANPAMLGMVIRPATVPRHSLQNILKTEAFTINHICKNYYKQGHQTSARYTNEESEFEAVGLTEEYTTHCFAPYVKEAKIKIGLELLEVLPIKFNNTNFVVGRIVEVFYPENCIAKDGFLDLEKAGTVAVSGLDSYHSTERLSRLGYAKPYQELKEIDTDFIHELMHSK